MHWMFWRNAKEQLKNAAGWWHGMRWGSIAEKRGRSPFWSCKWQRIRTMEFVYFADKKIARRAGDHPSFFACRETPCRIPSRPRQNIYLQRGNEIPFTERETALLICKSIEKMLSAKPPDRKKQPGHVSKGIFLPFFHRFPVWKNPRGNQRRAPYLRWQRRTAMCGPGCCRN